MSLPKDLLSQGPPIADVCCGSRMFWFDRHDDRCVFIDKRMEKHLLTDKSSVGGNRMLLIKPDIIADFTALPFNNDQFSLVVFDPPHFVRNGESGWMTKKYGKLTGNWRDMLSMGFTECFRVLKLDGTLIFKWNESDIPLREILKLTSERPLIGQRGGKNMKTHWVVFMKNGIRVTNEQNRS